MIYVFLHAGSLVRSLFRSRELQRPFWSAIAILSYKRKQRMSMRQRELCGILSNLDTYQKMIIVSSDNLGFVAFSHITQTSDGKSFVIVNMHFVQRYIDTYEAHIQEKKLANISVGCNKKNYQIFMKNNYRNGTYIFMFIIYINFKSCNLFF